MAEKKPTLVLIVEAIQELRRTHQIELDKSTDKSDRDYWQRRCDGCDNAILDLLKE